MNANDRISTFFDRKAFSFDAIYSGEKNAVLRLWDKLTRQNIHNRVEFTFNALSSLNGKTILDVGCGSGRYCVELAAQGAKEIVGIDVSLKMVELARQLAEQENAAQQCRFFQMDVMDLRGTFDDTIALGFFDYVAQPEKVLSHLSSLTRGKIVASFPALLSPRVPFRKMWLNANGCPVYFYTKNGISELCRKAGLSAVTLIRRGPIYLLVAQAKSDFKNRK